MISKDRLENLRYDSDLVYKMQNLYDKLDIFFYESRNIIENDKNVEINPIANFETLDEDIKKIKAGYPITKISGEKWINVSTTIVGVDKIVYGNKTWVALKSSTPCKLYMSVDAYKWSEVKDIEILTDDKINDLEYNNGVFIAVGDKNLKFISRAGISWKRVGLIDMEKIENLRNIAYNDGQYVMIGGEYGTILTSPDTIVWTQRISNANNELYGIIYDNNQYVVVGMGGIILTSSDGTIWTQRTSGTTQDLYSIIYANNQYIVVGNNSIILTSPDGTIWTQRDSGVAAVFNCIIYGNNLYVTVGSNGTILTSPDGIAWTQRDSGTTRTFQSITFGNDQYIVVGSVGSILTSPDGITWTQRTSGTTNSPWDIIYANNQYIAVGYPGLILTSPDGITWTQRTSGTTKQLNAIIYANNQYIAVGMNGSISSSLNGITWTTRDFSLSITLNFNICTIISYNNHLLFAGGMTSDTTSGYMGLYNTENNSFHYTPSGNIPNLINHDGRYCGIHKNSLTTINEYQLYLQEHLYTILTLAGLLTSKDMINWEPQNIKINSTLKSLICVTTSPWSVDNHSYFLTTSDGGIYTSSNGIDWTRQNSTLTTGLNSIHFANSLLVTVGDGGKILTSPDGIVWTSRTSGVSTAIHDIVFGGSNFWVYVGASGIIRTSPDAITWTNRTAGSVNHNKVIFANSLFVAVGNTGNIYTAPVSPTTWTKRTSNTTNNLNSIAYANSIYVAVGASGTILTSPDGTTWTVRTSGTTSNLNNITFIDNEFIVTGDNGLILTSTDGITWILSNINKPVNIIGIIKSQPNLVTSIKKTSSVLPFNINKLCSGRDNIVAYNSNSIALLSPELVVLNVNYDVAGMVDMIFRNGQYIAITSNNDYFKSVDGITWKSNPGFDNLVASPKGIGYGDFKYVVGADNGLYVSNAYMPIEEGYVDDNRVFVGGYDVKKRYGGGIHYVVVGSNGTILTSPDSITWTQRTSGTTNGLWDIIYTNNHYIIVGGNGTILTSPDSITWTKRDSGVDYELVDVIYTDRQYIVVGVYGIILTSPDGVTWTQRDSGTTNHLRGIIHGNGQYVIVGDSGNVLTSPDGIVWTKRDSGVSQGLMTIIYVNNQYIAVGFHGTILTSPDSITWTKRDSGVSNYLFSIINNDSTDNSNVHSSTINITTQKFSIDLGFTPERVHLISNTSSSNYCKINISNKADFSLSGVKYPTYTMRKIGETSEMIIDMTNQIIKNGFEVTIPDVSLYGEWECYAIG